MNILSRNFATSDTPQRFISWEEAISNVVLCIYSNF